MYIILLYTKIINMISKTRGLFVKCKMTSSYLIITYITIRLISNAIMYWRTPNKIQINRMNINKCAKELFSNVNRGLELFLRCV